MAATALSALFQHLHKGTLLTFVLPGGCNLHCGFCFIAKRGERAASSVFRPQQYQQFVADVAKHYPLSGVAVVGDEPLMEAAWPSTRALLSTARALQLPSAIITNGTLLTERASELADLDLQALLISVDAVGRHHDKLRGSRGAYDKIVEGVTSLLNYPRLQQRSIVASVAFPGRIGLLEELPPFLSRHRIKNWLISPLLVFPKGEPARVHPRLPEQLKKHLPALHAQAQALGIRLLVDDVLGTLPGEIFEGRHFQTRLTRRFDRPLSLLRMAPDGRLTNLNNVLQPLSPDLSKWNGVEPPHRLLARTKLMPIGPLEVAA